MFAGMLVWPLARGLVVRITHERAARKVAGDPVDPEVVDAVPGLAEVLPEDARKRRPQPGRVLRDAGAHDGGAIRLALSVDRDNEPRRLVNAGAPALDVLGP